MKYERIVTGVFRERPNRFIAMAEIHGSLEKCHVKNTGRCKELLVPGAKLYLQDSYDPEASSYIEGDGNTRADVGKKKTQKMRKTRYDVIGVEKNGRMINMDSQVPNKAVAEWLREGNLFSKEAIIRPEQRFGNSRFDLYIEEGHRKAFMEIKGVTLEENGVARFPDAPTERGIKHLQELCQCLEEGYEAYLFLLIQMKGVHLFEPNWNTHEAFGKALQDAQKAGVKILVYDSLVTEDSIRVSEPVPFSLNR